ncbi:MAG: hypothetical protein IH804_03785 [Planctomycetes bacterium]|nr:hypothetical protein [Planctomycetota bacterium]
MCDAETHDRDIAQTQALAQFVGRALAQLEKSESLIRTPGYNLFREVAETVGEDTWELFTAIQNLNPHAAGTRAELMRQQFEMLRAAHRALDVVATRPIAPPAYDVAIEIKEARGRRLWPVLAGWTATVAGFFGSFWLVLRWLAQRVPLPPGS